jgi:hypothetical protein
MGADGKSIKIGLSGIKPVDIMTIAYTVTDNSGNKYKGKVQSTIYSLRKNKK